MTFKWILFISVTNKHILKEETFADLLKIRQIKFSPNFEKF